MSKSIEQGIRMSAAARDNASHYTRRLRGRTMRAGLPALFFAASVSALAAITNVSVSGTTSTQAILQYTAPDEGVCAVEVSESASFTPLAHDVDPALFTGSNLDSRSEGTTSGAERVFVIGKRRAERGTDSHWYSRALQAFTRHYFRITCGADQATGAFRTTNIPLGNTYNEELPPDPNAGKSGYYINAGEYAWPEFVNWDKNSGRAETVIDPQTGMLLKRVSMPGDQPTGNRPAGDHSFTVVTSPSAAWSNPANVSGDDGASATFSGSGRDWLVLRDTALSYGDYYLESVTFSAKAWCSGPCTGDDAKIQVCLTVNGVSCWPDNNNTIDVTLGTTANPTSYVTAGSSAPIMRAWTPVRNLPLNTTDTKSRVGRVKVTSAGGVTWNSGDRFYPNWTAGSKITIAGSECNVSSVANPKALSIDMASCAPALTAQDDMSYSAGNFGVLIRKKTTSIDTISIQYAKYSMTESNLPGWTSSGSPQLCSDTLTQNAVTGGMGYHCVIPSSEVYWIDRSSGNANYLGLFFVPNQGGTDGWFAGGCGNASTTLVGAGPLDAEKFYCAIGDNTGKTVVLGCNLASNNQPGNLGISCSNLTKASKGLDLLTLIQQFTAGSNPVFDPVKFNGCSITGMQNKQLIMGCYRGYQDSIGWIVIFDPAKVDTAAGCVGNGNPGCVVAAQTSYAVWPARWCTIHTIFMSGDANVGWTLGKYMVNNGAPGSAPHVSTVASGTLTNTPSIAAGTAGCPPGSKGCDVVVVDGEPCNPNPSGSVGGHPAEGGNCPKNSAWEYVQDAQPGDVFQLPGSPSEFVVLISKNNNSWLIQRGYGYTTPGTPPTPVTLTVICGSRRFDYGASGSDWLWDFENDPHGQNTSGSTIKMGPGYTHPLPRPNVVVGEVAWVDVSPTVYGYAITDGPGYVPPNKFSQLGPGFAGTYGVAPYTESAQNHPSHPQNAASPKEQKWFLDARPLHGPGPSLVDQASYVSGQLYKFSSTTSDGDNLARIGGPNALFGGLNRKHQPTFGRCGTQPLIDVSSPVQGNTIADDSSSVYQYCVARRAGECRSGSARGDIYVNCPYVTTRPDNTLGCDYVRDEAGLNNDICIYNTGAYLNAVAQIGFEHSDPTGTLTRSVTKGLNRYGLIDANENVHSLPDASWLLIESNAVQGSAMLALAAKLPPYPEVDSVNRGTFVPMLLNLSPPPDLGIDNAVVQFGYLENGAANQYYCTSRKETCMAVSAGIAEVNPFRFASDGSDGTAATVNGVGCASGCSVTIPALPQRVVYYQVLYRNSSNTVVAQTRMQIAPVP
jgi:hypothetical protein